MEITDKEIKSFWDRYETNLKTEKELAILAYIFLPIAIIFRRYIREKYYKGNASALITNLWYLLKDDFKDQGKVNGKNDYAYLDYGEQSFRNRFKLFWFIPFKLNKSAFAAYMWMLRNNIWNYKETVAEEENGIYDDVDFKICNLKKNNQEINCRISTWAELKYTDSNDEGVANRGDKFSLEHSVTGEQEVYYRTFNDLVHGRYSKVYTWLKLPFGYQIAKEIQKGAGGNYFRYRNKTKLLKYSDEL